MAYRHLKTVLSALVRTLEESRELAADAHKWSLGGPGGPLISLRHKETMTEVAFLRGFLAWESFLEESFVLYLLGGTPPRGRPPFRYSIPPNQEMAMEWLRPESGGFPSWTDISKVIRRSERFFRDGKPYSPALKSQQTAIRELSMIRNAIAHSSKPASDKFKELVRSKLSTYPASLSVGGFLAMTMPSSHPPESFLDSYFGRIENVAERIVPI